MFIRPTLCLDALIIHPDDVPLRMPVEMFALWWDGTIPYLYYQNDDTALLVLSTDIVSVDDDFLFNLIKAPHRFFYTSIRLMYQEIRRIDSNGCCSGEESILSWFAFSENRYYHDLLGWWIDTIMIRLSGESILSRFANLEKNRFESNHKINENRGNRFKSILSLGYRC